MEFISDAIAQISGYAASEFIHNQSRTFTSIIHPDDRESIETLIHQAVAARHPYNLEYRILHRDGSIRWVAERGRATFDRDGKLLYLDGAIFDITDRMQAEEALRLSEATNVALIRAIPDLLIRANRDGTYLDIAGRDRLTLYGVANFLPGSSVRDSLPPDLAEQRMYWIGKALETGKLQIYEQQIVVNNQPQDEEVRIVVSNDDEVLIMVRDITDRKRAEQALRIAEENYRSIYEHALEGIFQSTPSGQYINVNPAMARIYGYDSPEQMLASVSQTDEQIYVDPSCRDEFQRLMEESGEVQGFEYQTYQTYQSDRNIIWVEENTRAVRDNTGKLLYYEGIIRDITERKLKEAELKRQLEELQVEIDQKKREREVAKITESDYFRELQAQAESFQLDEFWS
jgi:PAS domain S-box-containing protein